MTAPVATPLAAEPVFYLADEHAHAEGHSTMLGFWIYLMSDCLIFAILFATFGVLGGNYAAGPAPKDLFDLSLVAVNTGMLLMFTAVAVLWEAPAGLLLLVVAGIVLRVKLAREETLMAGEFPDQWPAYRARTRRLLPLVW